MLAPRLYEVSVFDAAKEHVFQFMWTGDQQYGVELTVRNNDSNNVVYRQAITTMRQEYALPAGAISNGNLYNAYVRILDSSGNYISDASNVVIFTCVATPTFVFTSPAPTHDTTVTIIKNSSFTAVMNYSQPQQDFLAEYTVLLYDAHKLLIRNYGAKTVSSYETQFTQIITGLENNFLYYIRATGVTANGLTVDTGYVPFNIIYETPKVFNNLDLVNDRLNGNIVITSNLAQVVGTVTPKEVYIDNKMLDVRDGQVVFDKGFACEESWTLGVSMYTPSKVNTPVLEWTDGTNKAVVYYREAVFDINVDKYGNPYNMGYYELWVDNPVGHTIIDSNYFEVSGHVGIYNGGLYAIDGVYYTGGSDGDSYQVKFGDPLKTDKTTIAEQMKLFHEKNPLKVSLWIVKENNYYKLTATMEEGE